MFSIISVILGLSPPPAWPSGLTGHVVRGIARAVREETSLGGASGGARAAARLAALVVNELVIFPVRIMPFAARTLRYRRSQMREVKLGERVLEVYERGGADGPLILYVHGGSWGQGAPWNYALMARRLLDGGAARVAVAQYGLFPAADVDEMVGDLDASLRWAEAEAGGSEVRLVGQSAGAHLCALWLARRAGAARLRGEPVGWLPSKFVALSGVYDIAAHFAHENTRLVHWLSPMWLAMAGRRGDAAADDDSFARLVLERAGLGGAAVPPSAAPALLAAEGVDADAVARAAEVDGGCERKGEWDRAALANWCAASPTRLLRLLRLCAPMPLGAAWPPTAVLHAADDGTVPVRSAREFVDALSKAGADVRTLEYAKGGHGEIPLALMGAAPLAEVEPRELGELCRAFVEEAAA